MSRNFLALILPRYLCDKDILVMQNHVYRLRYCTPVISARDCITILPKQIRRICVVRLTSSLISVHKTCFYVNVRPIHKVTALLRDL